MVRRHVYGLGFAALAQAVTSVAIAQDQGAGASPENLTPEQRMQRRFPQPVRVGFLVGLPMIDEANSVIGHVRAVIRTPQGKIQLIVPTGGVLGIGARLVAVPVEVVTMLGQFVAASDMPRAEFAKAPTWTSGPGETTLGPEESIRVGLSRR